MFTLEFESEKGIRVYSHVLRYWLVDNSKQKCTDVTFTVVNPATGETQEWVDTIDGIVDVYLEDGELFDSFERMIGIEDAVLKSEAVTASEEEPVNYVEYDSDDYDIILTAVQAEWIADMFCKLRKDWYGSAIMGVRECYGEETYACTVSNVAQMLGCEINHSTMELKKD